MASSEPGDDPLRAAMSVSQALRFPDLLSDAERERVALHLDTLEGAADDMSGFPRERVRVAVHSLRSAVLDEHRRPIYPDWVKQHLDVVFEVLQPEPERADEASAPRGEPSGRGLWEQPGRKRRERELADRAGDRRRFWLSLSVAVVGLLVAVISLAVSLTRSAPPPAPPAAPSATVTVTASPQLSSPSPPRPTAASR